MAALLVLAAALPPTTAAGTFEQVGHSPINSRGMNSALAIHGDYAYVGSRSDGGAPKGGIAVIDISDPAAPEVVHTVGPPDEGEPGLSSRELRVWPDQGLLIVLRFACEGPQSCADYGAPSSYRFYDIRGENAARPRLVATYEPSRVPHEFFLWADPRRPGRALLYMSTLTAKGGDDLLVTDISRARDGVFEEVTSWAAGILDDDGSEIDLHSLSIAPDGRRGYLAHLGAGFMVVDTSDLAEARPQPRVRTLTPVASRAQWGKPGAHSALPLPGRPWALVTDEVYGSTLGVAPALGVSVAIGCPWGWTRLVDVSDPARPRVGGEFKVSPYNDRDYCTEERRLQSEQATFSSHNPTVTHDLAFITWHSAGLQAVDLSDPAGPHAAGEFRPDPLPAVTTEDPTFSTGPDKLVFWSYPVIEDGLIYVVDIRNGLYVLRYRGAHSAQVSCASFLEGNSNIGQGAAPCPVALPNRPVEATRHGNARVWVACTTRDPAGCSTRLRMRRGARTFAYRRIRLRAGQEKAVGLHLWRAAVRLLRSRSSAAVVVEAKTKTPEGTHERIEAPLRLYAPGRAPAPAMVRRAAAPEDARLPSEPPPSRAELRQSGLMCVPRAALR
jgi:hypothetical protein